MKKNLLLAVFTIGVSSMSGMAEDGINVLENPGFEDVAMADVEKEYEVLNDLIVKPDTFTLTEEWKKYEDAIEFNHERIGSFDFVLAVKGEATVDELELIGH